MINDNDIDEVDGDYHVESSVEKAGFQWHSLANQIRE